MKVLVADDDPVVLHLVARLLSKDYEVRTARDGKAAWEILTHAEGPRLAVLNWQMPEIDGLEICRRVRRMVNPVSMHLLMLTAHGGVTDIRQGFEAGADDYLRKPFDAEELRARVGVGRRMLELREALAHRVIDLEEALARVSQLQGLLPICSWCKRIRNDQNYWEQVETYISEHSEASFTHGICPDCYGKMRSEAKAARASRP